jgi:hypothetical protein
VRAFSRLVPEGGEPVSPAGASRIHRALRLPASAAQLETWLAVCRVPRKDLPHYREAYAEVTAYRAPRRVPAARYRHAPAGRPALTTAENGRETVELTGLAAAVAQQLSPAVFEQILLTGVARLAGAQARRNGGGTYMPDMWFTAPDRPGGTPEIHIVEAKWQHGPGTPPPPLPPAAPSPTGPALPGPGPRPSPRPGPGRQPGSRLPRTPRRLPHATATPRAPVI